MLVAIPADGKDSGSCMAGRFARAPFFVIFNEEGNIVETIDNNVANVAHGAGGNAVKLLADHGVDAVIVPQVGPNASTALKMAGISAFLSQDSLLSDIIQQYLKGSLEKISL